MSQRFPNSHPEHPTKLQLGLPIHCWTKSRLQNKHLVDRGMFQPSGIIFYLGCLWEEHPNLNLQQIVKFLLWQAIIHVLCYVFKNIKTVNCYSSGIKDLTFRILWLTFVLNKKKYSWGVIISILASMDLLQSFRVVAKSLLLFLKENPEKTKKIAPWVFGWNPPIFVT